MIKEQDTSPCVAPGGRRCPCECSVKSCEPNPFQLHANLEEAGRALDELLGSMQVTRGLAHELSAAKADKIKLADELEAAKQELAKMADELKAANAEKIRLSKAVEELQNTKQKQ